MLVPVRIRLEMEEQYFKQPRYMIPPTLPSAVLLSSTTNFWPVLSFIFGKDDITFGLVASELVLSDFSCISGWVKLSVIAYKLFINFTSHLFSFVHSTLEIF